MRMWLEKGAKEPHERALAELDRKFAALDARCTDAVARKDRAMLRRELKQPPRDYIVTALEFVLVRIVARTHSSLTEASSGRIAARCWPVPLLEIQINV